MKQYFYSDGKDKFGPFSFEDLKSKEITRDNLVWFEGLKSWTSARDVEELESLFETLPPPLPIEENGPPPLDLKISGSNKLVIEEKSKRKIGNILIIGIILIAGVVAAVFFYNKYSGDDSSSNYSNNSSSNDYASSWPNEENNNSYSEPEREKTPEELEQELYDLEAKAPLSYLSISNLNADYKLFGDDYIITGKINSSATAAVFKDIVLNVIFYTKTNTELSRKEKIIYQYVKPNRSVSFSFRTKMPSASSTYDVVVKRAKVD